MAAGTSGDDRKRAIERGVVLVRAASICAGYLKGEMLRERPFATHPSSTVRPTVARLRDMNSTILETPPRRRALVGVGLAQAVCPLVRAELPAEAPVAVANPRPVPFREVVEALARAHGASPRLVPVPWPVAYAALRALEAAHLRMPFRADSLWGLAHPPPSLDLAPLAALGIAPRPFAPEAATVFDSGGR